jgi:hypothetical protein
MKLSIIVLLITSGLAIGCAPHYYTFKLVNKEKNVIYKKIKIEGDYFLDVHFPGNKIRFRAMLTIHNNTDEAIIVDKNDFKVSSQIYNYVFSHIGKVIDTTGMGREMEYYKEEPLTISPKNSVPLIVNFEIDREIKESVFAQERLKDTVELSVDIGKKSVLFKLKPDKQF